MRFARVLLLGLSLPLASPAGAFEAQTLDTPLFRVELVIFAHEPGALATTEDFLAALPEPTLEPIEPSVSLRRVLGLTADDTTSPKLEPVELPARFLPPPPLAAVALPEWRQLLDSDAGELVGIYRRLATQSDYRPLMHLIWEQPGEADRPASIVAFDDLRLGSPEIEGEASLSRSRFLHLELDLRFRGREAIRAVPVARRGAHGPEVVLMAPEYRLAESRRMRSGELHYFDHPAFGVIALIQPVQRTPRTLEPSR